MIKQHNTTLLFTLDFVTLLLFLIVKDMYINLIYNTLTCYIEITAYYPINDEENNKLYLKYKALADMETDVIFGGRLAEYKYYDMAPVIESAMEKWKNCSNC